MKKNILFTGSTLPRVHQDRLEGLGYDVKIERPNLSEEELIETLSGVSG